MNKVFLSLLFCLAASFSSQAQFDPKQMDSVRIATNEDYQFMLTQLKIDSLRAGPSGNPHAPHAANADESKASPYASLPDPLMLNNGEKVRDAETWWKKRRPEIVEYFDREVYGRIPNNVPEVTWHVMSIRNDTVENIPVIVKKLSGHVDNSSFPAISVDIQLTLTIPKEA